MKHRIISAFLLTIILIPILIHGGNLFNMTTYIISLLALNEFLKIKETKKDLPILIKLLSFIAFTFIIFTKLNDNLIYQIDYHVIAGIFLLFLIPTIFFHNRNIYSVNDAFFLIGSILFLGISFSLLILIRKMNLTTTIYLILISICGDIYAYLTGKIIGKHKLLEEISKNKTIEGLIAGIIFGAFIPFMYLITVTKCNYISTLIMTISLSIIGQIGDLCFSAIKRYYGKKDFSELIPGHGGIIDIIDSMIFILYGFMLFIKI